MSLVYPFFEFHLSFLIDYYFLVLGHRYHFSLYLLLHTMKDQARSRFNKEKNPLRQIKNEAIKNNFSNFINKCIYLIR
jgi:hypothetical protein